VRSDAAPHVESRGVSEFFDWVKLQSHQFRGVTFGTMLRDEGYRVVLVNSNPATIMTDPEFADRTYIEPMTAEVLEQIIAIERPQAILPTIGGQTGLNLAIEVAEAGVLEKYGVELIGANINAITPLTRGHPRCSTYARNFEWRANASASTKGSPYWSAYFVVAKKLGVPGGADPI
jgi:hypothetical protein